MKTFAKIKDLHNIKMYNFFLHIFYIHLLYIYLLCYFSKLRYSVDEITNTDEEKIDSKTKALEELNELGETLLKQSLSGTMSTVRSSQG